jgi:peptidoglycan/LPS O-acetylase OafA/YrhL
MAAPNSEHTGARDLQNRSALVGDSSLPTTERLAPIDVIKTVCIGLVVAIHAMGEPGNAAEDYFGQLSRVAVPMFLAISGWLHATEEPIPWKRTLGRLKRLLIPYLIASILAEYYLASRGEPRSALRILHDLMLGDAFGPYYYVFAIVTMTLLGPIFARVPRRWLLVAWFVLVALRAVVIVLAALVPELLPRTDGLFWVTRDPNYNAIYFLAGWIAALYRETLGNVCRKHRTSLLSVGIVAAGTLSAIAPLREVPLAANLAGWLNTLVAGAVLAVAASGIARTPRIVRHASDATYAVYLFHLFFVDGVNRALPPSTLQEVSAWCAGMLGSVLVIAASRWVLRERSRTWVGA